MLSDCTNYKFQMKMQILKIKSQIYTVVSFFKNTRNVTQTGVNFFFLWFLDDNESL